MRYYRGVTTGGEYEPLTFLNVDPLTGKFPMLTPYQFASNSPISGVDLDGLELKLVILDFGKDGKLIGKPTVQIQKDYTIKINNQQ